MTTMTNNSTNIPFTIIFCDRDDLTNWDTRGEGDMSDPEAHGWQIEPMGGTQFLVVAPSGEETTVTGQFDGATRQ